MIRYLSFCRFLLHLRFLYFPLIIHSFTLKYFRSKSICFSINAAAKTKVPTSDNRFVVRNEVSIEEMLQFARLGHVNFKAALNPEFIENTILPEFQQLFKSKELKALQHVVQVVINDNDCLPSTVEECQAILKEKAQPDDIPFLQLFHLWREHEIAKQLALSPELGKLAAQLLGVNKVRLYQDSLFVKRPMDGATEWHSDLNMVPLDTNDYITCWIPLQNIPSVSDGGSTLEYASGSHRDFSLLYCKFIIVFSLLLLFLFLNHNLFISNYYYCYFYD
jgi:hypothetical protein